VRAHKGGAILKVILETALLDDNQKCGQHSFQGRGRGVCENFDGLLDGGATVHDVALMRQVSRRDGVKPQAYSNAGGFENMAAAGRPASAPAPASNHGNGAGKDACNAGDARQLLMSLRSYCFCRLLTHGVPLALGKHWRAVRMRTALR